MSRTSPLAVSVLALSLMGLGYGAAKLPSLVASAYAAEATAEAGQGDDAVVALVDGSPIRFSDVALADEEMGDQLASMPEARRFQYLISMLIDRRVIAQAAREKKFQDDPEVKRRETYFNEKVLRDVYWVHLIREKATDEALRAYYDETIGKAPVEKEAHAAHILVSSKAEADKIEVELKGGAKFADVAKAYSKDGSSADGGDLGWFKKGDVVPEFGEAAFKLKPGGVSEPIQTQFGWHVIRLDEIRDAKKPTFEEAHDQVLRELVRKEGQDLIQTLRKSAKVDIVGPDGKTTPLPTAEETAPEASQRPQLAPAPPQ